MEFRLQAAVCFEQRGIPLLHRFLADGINLSHAWTKPDDFYIGGCDYALVNDCSTAEEFAARAGELFQQILEQQDRGLSGVEST